MIEKNLVVIVSYQLSSPSTQKNCGFRDKVKKVKVMSFRTVAQHKDEKIKPMIRIETLLSKVSNYFSMIFVKFVSLFNISYCIDEIEDGHEEDVYVKFYRMYLDVDNRKLNQFYELLMPIIIEQISIDISQSLLPVYPALEKILVIRRL